ncbi:MAG: Mrp/NBP35 family ATP-binding protein [bacterium]|nr:Mrp/NBP35 family ATP-binding protein [bacterium]MCP4968418.1 Mrp/NBP35 family ATP-binding protein [bacterium]
MSPSEIDPRSFAVEDRLAGVSRIVGVTGSKGGIGKSVVASTLALTLADRGMRVGLFDLDFTSPSDHVVLGVSRSFPEEEFGIEPHLAHGIHLMSIAFFAGDAAVPLRGGATTNALLELLAITRWGELEVLVLDMPPGLGDTSLDVIRLLPRLEFLLVGNGSKVVVESVKRALQLFSELDVPMVGLLENMRRGSDDAVASLAATVGVPFLGSVPYDPDLEAALGDVDQLRQSILYRSLVGVLTP